MTGIARATQLQQVHYLRKAVNYNDANIGTGNAVGAALPKGAVILSCTVQCDVAFNAGTTNALQIGTAAGGTQIVNDAATSGTRQTVPNLVISADTDVFITYAQTGTAATAGHATVVVSYAVNNDA